MNGMTRPAMHSDEPIQKNAADRFGRRGLASEIAEVAATADPPLVLGVHGDWGSGKTSFMRQVQDALAQAGHAERIVTVWFEAWRYQNEPAPLVALLQEMRRSFPPFEKAKSKMRITN
jgi:predicted KAP-like P-loop ATPase